MESFLDIHQSSLNKYGEELCGDQARVVKTPAAVNIVLSDGLGSGVKANILANLTAEIIATMLREEIGLQEIIDTVIRTLPVDKARRIAYATFSILTIDTTSYAFRSIHFDSPQPFWIHENRLRSLEAHEEKMLERTVTTGAGVLEMGDFIGLASDGVLYAGPGKSMDLSWDWQAVGGYIEELFTRRVYTAHSIANSLMTVTNQRYQFRPGDDASFIGVLRRQRHTLMVFTGPPLDTGFDYVPVDRFLEFPGRKVICGGTTANIVAAYLKAKVETDMSSQTGEIPAIGRLPGVDLVTEGIITLAAVLDALKRCEGQAERLEPGHNAVYLLASELLQADAIEFIVGQSINPAYQNPLLPKDISIRKYLVERLAETLEKYHKDVQIEYY